jgi:hypothetical protein
MAWAGAAVAHLGFAAMAVSTVWTAMPLSPLGLFERYMVELVGLVLIAAGTAGRTRLAGSTPGRLLCALGAGMCLRLAVDPTIEKLPALSAKLPMWAIDAYPGLATAGWLLAALGALIWWLGGGKAGDSEPYRGLAALVGLALVAATLAVGAALRAAGYEVPTYDNLLLVWRTVEVVVALVVAVSVSGRRGFGPWPMILLGAGLLGHVARTLLAPPPA